MFHGMPDYVQYIVDEAKRRFPYELRVDLRRLRSFLAVAEERNFGAAARRLHLAQPPLSQQIAGLERELDVQLFDRSRRPVALTAAGQVLAREAADLLEHADRLEHRMRRVRNGQAGRLVVSAVSSTMLGVAPLVLRRHRERYPDVEIVLHEWDTKESLDALASGRLDVAFLLSVPRVDGLSVVALHREPIVVVLPSTHPAAVHDRVDLTELADQPFVTYPRDRAPDNFDLLIGACERAGFRPRMLVQGDPHHTQVSFVAAGIGVALVPASVSSTRLPGIVYRRLAGREPEVETTIAWRPESGWPAREVFVREAQAAAADPPREWTPWADLL